MVFKPSLPWQRTRVRRFGLKPVCPLAAGDWSAPSIHGWNWPEFSSSDEWFQVYVGPGKSGDISAYIYCMSVMWDSELPSLPGRRSLTPRATENHQPSDPKHQVLSPQPENKPRSIIWYIAKMPIKVTETDENPPMHQTDAHPVLGRDGPSPNPNPAMRPRASITPTSLIITDSQDTPLACPLISPHPSRFVCRVESPHLQRSYTLVRLPRADRVRIVTAIPAFFDLMGVIIADVGTLGFGLFSSACWIACSLAF